MLNLNRYVLPIIYVFAYDLNRHLDFMESLHYSLFHLIYYDKL